MLFPKGERMVLGVHKTELSMTPYPDEGAGAWRSLRIFAWDRRAQTWPHGSPGRVDAKSDLSITYSG
jgi:hypothetical protein